MRRLRRHRLVALVAFALPLVAMVTALLVLPRLYESTSVVHVAPLGLAGLDPSWKLDPTATEAEAEERGIADGEFRTVMDQALAFPFSYEVEADAHGGTIRFETRAGSSVEAYATALAAAAGFAGLHNDVSRVDRAIAGVQTQIETLDAELADPVTVADPTVSRQVQAQRDELQARLDHYQRDRALVVAGLASTGEGPNRPSEPASPDFVALVGIAAAVGAVAALVACWVADRRRPPAAEPLAPAAHRGPRLVLEGVSILLAPALLVVVGLTGWHTVWELRRVTDQQVADQVECTKRWLAEVPEGATIYPQPDPPEAREEFWVAALTESAFPRLQVAQVVEDADYTVQIVPEGDPAPGQLPCASYKMILTER